MSLQAMSLQENVVVAERFRLVRMIGRGGMGSVWQAMHLGLDTPCALKFIEGEMANAAEAHARFEREAKAAAQLRSPHVVQIFDHGVWQGRPFIAMELLDGEDLAKRIDDRGGRLAPAEISTIVQQVCRALNKAHQAGVVHRDLKPDNIFLVRDDDRELVKILDFGVAKKSSQALDGSNTKTGAMLGTPYYMSPEQAQGIKSVDARSDLWSLAVIVFQCITGRLPFESEALGDLLVKIIVQPVPVPSQHTLGPVPPGFDRWWSRAADRNPDNRFQSAKAFAESLQLALGQSSVTEITDQHRIVRFGGQTALLTNDSLATNTPSPMYSQGAASPIAQTIGLTTPQPSGAGLPLSAIVTPAQAMPAPPMQVHSTASGVVSFASADVAPVIPKKAIPVPLIAALAVLGLVGVVGTGVAVVKRSSAAPTSTSANASASVTAAPPPVASPVATGAPVETATVAEPTPTVTTVSHPTKPVGKPTAKPPPSAKPTASSPTAKPSATWNAGF